MVDRRTPVYLLAGSPGVRLRRGPDPLLQAALGVAAAGAAGKKSRGPSVAYVGAASGDNRVFRLWIDRTLKHAGAREVTLAPLCGRRADPKKARAVVEAADIVFVSGGDVDAGMEVLHAADMVEPLRALHREGKPFFGISAGSIMLGREWVRWRDPDDDASAELFACLDLAPVACDTHGEGDGWEELKALVRLAPAGVIGHGIVSGNALVVAPDGALAALGGEVHRFRRDGGRVVQIESLRPAG